jgi:hypothetical protein
MRHSKKMSGNGYLAVAPQNSPPAQGQYYTFRPDDRRLAQGFVP